MEDNVFLQKLVSAYYDIGFAVSHLIQSRLSVFGWFKARKHFNLYRPVGKTIFEVFIMLLRK